jgi:hypothetical protein
MYQLPNENPRLTGGGDKRTPAAKVDIAKREQQIVELRLRNTSFSEIGRTVGVSKQAAVKAFQKALRRNTDADIQTHHRCELAKLDVEEANVWRVMDANKDKPKVQFDGTAQLRGIHVRRAKLLGLDAPQKLDVGDMYRTGAEEVSAARLERRRLLEAMTPEEQVYIYEAFEAAQKRLARGSTETTVQATATTGTEYRNGGADPVVEVEKVEEKEERLCSNEKCTAGEDYKRKRLGSNMEIIEMGGVRYCSKFCQAQASLR